MKTVYLLAQIGTSNIYDTIFVSKKLAEQKIAEALEKDDYDSWEILELKLHETI